MDSLRGHCRSEDLLQAAHRIIRIAELNGFHSKKKTQYKYDLANPIDQLCMVNHPIFSKAIHWFVLLVANYHASSWGSGTLVICFHACWLRQNNASDSNVSAAGSTGFFVDFSVKSWGTPFSLSQPIHWFNKLL